MRALGIDFGLSRVGVSFSEGSIASGIGTFTAKTKKEKVTLMRRLLNEYHVDTLVFGKTESTVTEHVNALVSEIKHFFRGTIVFVEEAMTTREAHALLLQTGSKRKKRRDLIDTYAAILILQSYLDEQKN